MGHRCKVRAIRLKHERLRTDGGYCLANMLRGLERGNAADAQKQSELFDVCPCLGGIAGKAVHHARRAVAPFGPQYFDEVFECITLMENNGIFAVTCKANLRAYDALLYVGLAVAVKIIQPSFPDRYYARVAKKRFKGCRDIIRRVLGFVRMNPSGSKDPETMRCFQRASGILDVAADRYRSANAGIEHSLHDCVAVIGKRLVVKVRVAVDQLFRCLDPREERLTGLRLRTGGNASPAQCFIPIRVDRRSHSELMPHRACFGRHERRE